MILHFCKRSICASLPANGDTGGQSINVCPESSIGGQERMLLLTRGTKDSILERGAVKLPAWCGLFIVVPKPKRVTNIAASGSLDH